MGEKRRCCPCCSSVVCIACLVCVGFIITCLGAASIPLLDDIFRKELKKRMILKNGSESYNNWQKSPAPIYMQFYIFNYTNVDDFMSGKSKPNVKEKGPYSYRELRVNEVIEQDDQFITYLPNNTYVFDPDTSCGDCREEDTLTVVNAAILTVMQMVKELNIKNPGWILKKIIQVVNFIINGDKDFRVFTKLTVHDLLWGYYNPVLQRLKFLEELFKHFEKDLPPIDDFVALEYNGTKGALHEGNLTISTGIDDVDNAQKILKWRGLPKAPYWQTNYGEMLNGTDGTRFKPFISRDDRIFIFNSDICRSLYLEYDSDDSIMGVPLYRYSTTSHLFANSSVNPDNRAFCGPKHCYGSGILPLGQCQTGHPPVFMSAPHFYQGDPSLLDAVNGLNPIKAKHATFVSVEPRTGLAFSGYKRIQINVMAQPDEYFDIMRPFTRNFTFLPLLWVQETAVIDKASVEKFKEEVVKPQLILKWLSNGLMILGAVIVVCTLLVGFLKKRKISKKYNLLGTDDANNRTPKTA